AAALPFRSPCGRRPASGRQVVYHSRLKLGKWLLLVALLGGVVADARAQAIEELPKPMADWRSASLVGWHKNVRVATLDRWHAFGGLFFDRGIFRRFTPGMDHEYDMDVLTDGFTPAEDRQWYTRDHAIRSYLGSIHRSRFATKTEARHRIELGSNGKLQVDALQQEDLTAQRFFVEIGYAHAFSDRHTGGFSQTIAAYKPDLDFTLFYNYRAPQIGRIDLQLVFLDVANNFIFDVLGTDPVLEDTVRSYDKRPLLFDVYWRSTTTSRLRWEVVAGIQRPVSARVFTQRSSDLEFRWRERLHYGGFLLEYDHPIGTVGLYVTETSSAIARRATMTGTSYESAQSSRTATLYALAPIWRLQASLWLRAERYRDRQTGDNFDAASIHSEMDYLERRLTLQARLAYVPEQGFRVGLEYLVDCRLFHRDSHLINEYLQFLPWTPNGRLSAH